MFLSAIWFYCLPVLWNITKFLITIFRNNLFENFPHSTWNNTLILSQFAGILISLNYSALSKLFVDGTNCSFFILRLGSRLEMFPDRMWEPVGSRVPYPSKLIWRTQRMIQLLILKMVMPAVRLGFFEVQCNTNGQISAY